jgi:putative FmdB family regulatory protein
VPTYEYRCNDCGHQFEVSQRMSDEPLTECEVCGGEVSKLLFAPAIHFKGTGFHNTDYASKRRSASGDEGGGSGSESGSGEGSSNGKTDSGGDSAASTPAKTETSSSSSKKTVGLDKI